MEVLEFKKIKIKPSAITTAVGNTTPQFLFLRIRVQDTV